MRKFYRRYPFIPLFLLLTVIIFSGCGGEDGGSGCSPYFYLNIIKLY